MPLPTDLPGDPHDPRWDLDRQDCLVLAALGEPIAADFEAHCAVCTRCRADLAALSRTVQLARAPQEDVPVLDAVPSQSVWTGIAAELGLADETGHTRARRASRGRMRRWAGERGLWLVAAALLVALAAAGVGYLVGQRSSTSARTVTATAQLAAFPGGPTGVTGAASIRSLASGTELSVATRGLPLRQGYYEVWLFDPGRNQMVALGTLADNGAGTFPVPPGLDPRSYHVVDVSAQNYDGNPVHQQSVLRGELTQ